MRTVKWLHICDLQLRVYEELSQHAVSTSMVGDKESLYGTGLVVDYALSTKDLASS